MIFQDIWVQFGKIRKTSNRWVTFIPNFGKGVGKVALFKMQLLHTSPKDLLDLHKLHTFPSHP